MPTRQNRYFNNPQMAAAFSNLAGIFAPPSAQDFLAMAQTEGVDFRNDAARQTWGALTADGVTPEMQDRFGLANMATFGDAGWTPSNSFEQGARNNAVTMRGQDIDAGIARRAQDIGLAQAYATNNLNHSQTIPGLPPEAAEALGLGFDLPAVTGAELGAPPAPESISDIDAELLRAAVEAGDYTLEDVVAQRMGLTGATTVLDDENNLWHRRLVDAVGERAVHPHQGQAKPITFMRNGVRIGGRELPDGRVVDMEGVPLTPEEAGSVARVGQVTGSPDEFGGQFDRRAYLEAERNLDSSQLLVQDIRALVQEDGQAVSGIGGAINVLANDLPAVAGEIMNTLEARFGSDDQPLTRDAIAAVGRQAPSGYDDTQVRARNLLLQLAYAQARVANGGAPVGIRAVERAIESIGASGALSSNQRVLGVLRNFEQTIENERIVNQRHRERSQTGAPETLLPGAAGSAAAGQADPQQLLDEAREAIAQGADMGAVIERLIEMGVDPGGL